MTFTTLAEQESLIRQSLIQMGQAFQRIRDEMLYKQAKCPNFAFYCEKVWGITPNYANRLIRAATAAQELSTLLPMPEMLKESHLRLLNGLKTKEQKATALALAVQFSQDEGVPLKDGIIKSGIEITQQLFATGTIATFQEAMQTANNEAVRIGMMGEVSESAKRHWQHVKEHQQSDLIEETIYPQLPPDVLLGYSNMPGTVRRYAKRIVVIIENGANKP